ncbi:MAG: helix-turn-helix domain-containing protein [Rhizobiales bacterium]|nr:helix-turn-helix domain-containing protein [Hyphomicrobiales bacterium]
MQHYLSTDEAAAYLKIKERKLYDLASAGAVPCSKVTGKWLFPRAALDRWVEAGLAQAGAAKAPPAILAGSHDPLLEWAARRSGSGLALLAEGSQAGLARLERDEAAIAAIHLHGEAGDDEAANADAIRARPGLHDVALIGFARREQGLVTAPGNPLGLASLADAAARGARFGLRQAGAGAQLLLARLLAAGTASLGDLSAAPAPFATGADLAAAIRAGEVDCGLASRSVAVALGLGFVPLAWERFDLALRRRSYFEAGPQALFALMRSAEFARQAERLGGYDTADAGAVRLNR